MSDFDFEPTFAPTDEQFTDGVPNEPLYREDWPYNFKWGVNGETGVPEVWRVNGGIDGRPTHRGHLRSVWGRETNSTEKGDLMGLALYTPPTTTFAGEVLKPSTVRIVTYYGKSMPGVITQWFAQHFPGAQIQDAGNDPKDLNRLAKIADTFDPTHYVTPEANMLKWAWHPDKGTLLWRADTRGLPTHRNLIEQSWGRKQEPSDRTGWVDETDGEHAIEPYVGLPPLQCISDVKAELAKQLPDARIRLPETQEDHGIEESFGTDGPRLGGIWASLNLSGDSITLLYGFEGSLPKLEEPIEITFDELAFARGEDKKEHAFRTANYKPHSIPWVTDGKVLKIDMTPFEFLRMYPPDDFDYKKAEGNLATGWIVPTDDGMGYGIQGAVGLRAEQPGAHEIVKLLDDETGKPCHYIHDEGSSQWSSSPSG